MTKITTPNTTLISLSEKDMESLEAEQAVVVTTDDMVFVLRYEPQ